MRTAAQSTSKVASEDSYGSKSTGGALGEDITRLWRCVAIATGVRQVIRRREVSVMFRRVLLSVAICVGSGSNALAQDAAETAIILGGSGAAQGQASRSLGSAAASSIGGAAEAVRSGRESSAVIRRTPARQARQMIALPGDVDVLEHTDAPTYELSNGASIRVSGGLRPSAQSDCADACPER